MNLAEKKDWAGRPIEERRYYIAQQMHVGHPDFVRAMLAIKRAAQACKNDKKGYGILALAPSGAGKTYLGRFLKQKWPDVHSEWKSEIRVLQVDLPSRMNRASVMKAFLKALLGPDVPLIGDRDALQEQVVDLIGKAGTRVVVIDNVHDIPVRRREGGIKEIGDLIRDLIDDTKCLFVLLGAPSALQVVSINPQLKRRAFRQVRIDYFQIDMPVVFSHFRRFIDKLDAALPLAELCRFSDDNVREIHWATFGIWDNIQQLISAAVEVATTRGAERIERDDLANAFDDWVIDGIAPELNPFRKGGVTRPLTEPGELYYDWQDTWRNPLKEKRSSR